jgi:hypothetical protein
LPTDDLVVGKMDIKDQIFQRLLQDGNPLILEPFQAKALATGRPAEPHAGSVQAHITYRLRSKGLRPVKISGRWVFHLAEIARWMASCGPGAPTEPSQRPGSGRWGKPGRPSATALAARAAAQQRGES